MNGRTLWSVGVAAAILVAAGAASAPARAVSAFTAQGVDGAGAAISEGVVAPVGGGVGLLSAGKSAAQAVVSGANGRVAYTSATTSFGEPNICFIRNDGGGSAVSVLPGREPSWSPDGRKIAFSRSVVGAVLAAQIYVARADGGDVTPITRGSFDHGPS